MPTLDLIITRFRIDPVPNIAPAGMIVRKERDTVVHSRLNASLRVE
jgi:hypothetical protein